MGEPETPTSRSPATDDTPEVNDISGRDVPSRVRMVRGATRVSDSPHAKVSTATTAAATAARTRIGPHTITRSGRRSDHARAGPSLLQAHERAAEHGTRRE